MEFLYLLESIRNPVLDAFFSAITHLGSETLFLAIAIIIFWCFSKKTGYYLMITGFFGTLLNQFLKLVCQVPRPWVRDPNFTIVEAARADATGYSFPSGHTQSVMAALGCPARSFKNTAFRIVCIVLIALTALSRMYLGVHTPADVGVSLLIGAVLLFGLYPLFEKSDEKPAILYILTGILTLCSLAYVIFVEVYPWSTDVDSYNLEHGIKNGYLLFGCGCGLLVSIYVETRWIRFDPKAKWWAQILKTVIGLGLVLALKAGLKPILSPIFGGHIAATALRYFLLVVFAACVWPLTFPWFAKGCPISRKAKKLLITLLIIVLVIAVLAAVLFWVVTRDTKAAPISTDNAENPLITPLGTTMLSGHRAGGGIAPENTMMAIRNCVESSVYNLDVFEFDVHLTADGVLVLLHDSTLDRTSDAEAVFGESDVEVGEKTFYDLKKLNMGARFENENGEMPFADIPTAQVPSDLRITGLEEVLDYLESAGNYRYIIEIKNGGELGLQAADALYGLLAKYDCLERAVVGTFHNEVTAYMDETYPDMHRSAGVNECIKFYLYSLLNLKADEDTFPFAALQIPTTDYVVNLGTSRVVNYAHANNIAVQYWTINDLDEMARLQSIGADAIMTDIPDAAVSVLVQP